MTIATLALAGMMMFTPTLEDGATFDGGLCWEADGTEGLSSADGQCVTAADYDAMFSYENLSTVPSSRWGDEGKSIAEVDGVVDDGVVASERPLGDGVTAKPFTFVGTLVYAHGLPIRLA